MSKRTVGCASTQNAVVDLQISNSIYDAATVVCNDLMPIYNSYRRGDIYGSTWTDRSYIEGLIKDELGVYDDDTLNAFINKSIQFDYGMRGEECDVAYEEGNYEEWLDRVIEECGFYTDDTMVYFDTPDNVALYDAAHDYQSQGLEWESALMLAEYNIAR